MKPILLKILVITIVLMFVLAVSGQKTGKKPLGAGKKQQINWTYSLQSAFAEAERTNKIVMADFWATWCAPCRAMDERTYTHPSVIEQAKKFIMVKIDIEKSPDEALNYQVETPPKVVFLKADGSVINGFVGFRNAVETVRSMKSALNGSQQK